MIRHIMIFVGMVVVVVVVENLLTRSNIAHTMISITIIIMMIRVKIHHKALTAVVKEEIIIIMTYNIRCRMK